MGSALVRVEKRQLSIFLQDWYSKYNNMIIKVIPINDCLLLTSKQSEEHIPLCDYMKTNKNIIFSLSLYLAMLYWFGYHVTIYPWLRSCMNVLIICYLIPNHYTRINNQLVLWCSSIMKSIAWMTLTARLPSDHSASACGAKEYPLCI